MNEFTRRLFPSVGDTGHLDGTSQRIDGLARLRTEGPDLYQWIEYRLLDPSGRERTLVREEESSDVAWHLFETTEVTPVMRELLERGPRLGEDWTFQGRTFRIDYTSQSRVVGIEGTPPSGYRINQLDRFFNSKSGDLMLVVSRDASGRVSCYEGRTLFPGVAESAFNLDATPSRPIRWEGHDASERSGGGHWLGPVFFGVIFLITFVLRALEGREPQIEFIAPPAKELSPWGPIVSVSLTSLDGRTHRRLHSRSVEIRRPDRWSNGELAWFDATTHETLIAFRGGLIPGDQAFLGQPFPLDLAPAIAAIYRPGAELSIGHQKWRVNSLFQLVPQGTPSSTAILPSGLSVWQGLVATGAEQDQILLLWNDLSLVAYRLDRLPPGEAERLWPRVR